MKFFRDVKGFLFSTANDERIPSRDKKILLALIALLISPLDLIPDWIPVIGLLDDFFMLSIILDYFFQVLDSRILLSHYPWGMKSFARLRAIARALQFFVPRFVKKKLWSYVGDPY
ncbi:MAG TPA: YkvA family protein [Bacteriovoracaceae bacterium]|nr:YkvA family protein [Bacteriovoracaceae bacterium]